MTSEELIFKLITQIGFPIALIVWFIWKGLPKFTEDNKKSREDFTASLKEQSASLKEQRDDFRIELKEQREHNQANTERFFATQTVEHQRIESKITEEAARAANKVVDHLKINN